MSLKKSKKNSKEEEYKINPGHYLELMDRLHIIGCNLHEHCFTHPLATKDKEIENMIDIALHAVWDAYQYVGYKEYENEGTLHGEKCGESPKE